MAAYPFIAVEKWIGILSGYRNWPSIAWRPIILSMKIEAYILYRLSSVNAHDDIILMS